MPQHIVTQRQKFIDQANKKKPDSFKPGDVIAIFPRLPSADQHAAHRCFQTKRFGPFIVLSDKGQGEYWVGAGPEIRRVNAWEMVPFHGLPQAPIPGYKKHLGLIHLQSVASSVIHPAQEHVYARPSSQCPSVSERAVLLDHEYPQSARDQPTANLAKGKPPSGDNLGSCRETGDNLPFFQGGGESKGAPSPKRAPSRRPFWQKAKRPKITPNPTPLIGQSGEPLAGVKVFATREVSGGVSPPVGVLTNIVEVSATREAFCHQWGCFPPVVVFLTTHIPLNFETAKKVLQSTIPAKLSTMLRWDAPAEQAFLDPKQAIAHAVRLERPLLRSTKQQKYMFVAIDQFSKFLTAIPILQADTSMAILMQSTPFFRMC
ncbi:unnamed protein product [Notodromas monacha]|uniref:Uncharacterized protein n=1 Tax=Notodromas monacha TaxID=399045 RepID=A0A7R9BY60_9CRUS|nr:unnamed protein product [Notodromas monacha]CAG0922410.1 unnamed protein product [Notodromas monacha]